MADVFASLKHNKIDCEMCTEFAKDLVWERRAETFKDQLYLLAKQNHKLFRCNGKVDVIVTDIPLLMMAVYNDVYNNGTYSKDWDMALDTLITETFNSYNNLNIFLKRVKPYNPNGRNETEEEAKQFDIRFKNMLDDRNINYINIDADDKAKDTILDLVKEMLYNSSIV